MPAQGRLGDKSSVPADGHGCPGCPHPCVGPATGGSPDVMVNGLPALRVGDPGIHAACCGPNTWKAKAGAAGVFINGKKAHRLGDADTHCGGTGKMIEGSSNVFVGDYSSSSGTAPEHSEVLISSDKLHQFSAVLTAPDGRVIANMPVTVTLPDGSERHLRSNNEGRISVHGIDPGTCSVRMERAVFEVKG